MKKVVVIEDDPEIVDLLEIHLKDQSCEVFSSGRGEEAMTLVETRNPDLLILDIMLPGMDGIEVCRRLRAKGSKIPILMLTAKSEEIDKVLGLEMGADDYLTKPFSIREFIARVKAIFRRHKMLLEEQELESARIMHFDHLTIDIEMRKVLVDGRRVDLSPKEFELLVLLSSNPGKSYDRSKLLEIIWGYDFQGYEHTVNSHINRLRSKIEPDMAQPKYVLTTWGVGYKFNEEL